MARELWLSTIASAASGSTDEMLIPSNGAVLTIADMTSGNVNVQSYATGSWVTVETYTADTVINVGVAPGTLTRITWDTVVGTPTISLMYASDNGFAEAAGDIVAIEASLLTKAYAVAKTGVSASSAIGANAVLATISVPSGAMGLNSQLVITCDFTSGGVVGARTITVAINDGSSTNVLVTTMSATTSRGQFRIAQRGVADSQRNTIDWVTSLTLAFTSASNTTKTLTGAFTVTITATNPSDTLSLESYLAVIYP